MRRRGRLLRDSQPGLLHLVQQAVLRAQGKCLLRHDVLHQLPNLLHHEREAVLCDQGKDLLRLEGLRQ